MKGADADRYGDRDANADRDLAADRAEERRDRANGGTDLADADVERGDGGNASKVKGEVKGASFKSGED